MWHFSYWVVGRMVWPFLVDCLFLVYWLVQHGADYLDSVFNSCFQLQYVSCKPCMLGNFAYFFLLSADFFQNYFFLNILSGIPWECQMVWIQIRTDVLSVLILVQTVLQRLSADNKSCCLQGKINVNYLSYTTGAWSSILKLLLNAKTENLIMSLRSNDQEWN